MGAVVVADFSEPLSSRRGNHTLRWLKAEEGEVRRRRGRVLWWMGDGAERREIREGRRGESEETEETEETEGESRVRVTARVGSGYRGEGGIWDRP